MSNRGIASRPATLLGRCVPRDQEHWSGAGHDLTTGTNMLGIGSETSSTATTALNLMPSSRATARLTTFTRIFCNDIETIPSIDRELALIERTIELLYQRHERWKR